MTRGVGLVAVAGVCAVFTAVWMTALTRTIVRTVRARSVQRRRAEELRAWAAATGWRYSEEDAPWPWRAQLPRGAKATVRRSVDRVVRGRHVVVADYTYATKE